MVETLTAPRSVTVVIPSFNESANVAEMVSRLDAAFAGDPDGAAGPAPTAERPEVLYVDDSRDDTPAAVTAAAATTSAVDVRVIHRDVAVGGLSGAVALGLSQARGDVVVVMDADLQHPPEMVPAMAGAVGGEADVVVASRYVPGGSSGGLDGPWRTVVSRSSGWLARACFPRRLRACTDPMTGFFALDATTVDPGAVRAKGFKVLLEILATHPLRVVEVPLVFGERHAGDSKASAARGLEYLGQLARLRWERWDAARVVGFGAVGALGALANLAIMAGLMALDVHYVLASIVAAEATIVGNFLLAERTVFASMVATSPVARHRRLLEWLGVNNLELVVRTGVLVALVSLAGAPELPAQAVLLGLGFGLRYVVSRHVIYRSRRGGPAPVPALVGPAEPGPGDVLAATVVHLPEQRMATGLDASTAEHVGVGQRTPVR